MGKRRRSRKDTDHDPLSEVARNVGDVIGEVGDAGGDLVDAVASNFNRRGQQSPEERLVRKAAKKKRDWLGHRNAYIATNAGLLGINLATTMFGAEFMPWFLFPLMGWGIGLGIHALNYRTWKAENSGRLERAEAVLALQSPEQAALVQAFEAPPPEIAIDPLWSDLLTRCRRAAERARKSLSEADADDTLALELGARLDEGLSHLEQLARGAVDLKRSVTSVEPEGYQGLQRRIIELERRIHDTDDSGLRDIHRANRDLLAARAGKVRAIESERERMQARAEGFLLAVENIRLDASRLRSGAVPAPDTLTEPLKHLSDEVHIMQQVRADLAEL